MCAGARARAGVLLVSTLCVCWGQGYGWSIAREDSVCVCVLGPWLGLEYC